MLPSPFRQYMPAAFSAILAVGACLIAPDTAQALRAASKSLPTQVGSNQVAPKPISDADLQSMARKINRARVSDASARALRKAAPRPPTPLASTLAGPMQRGLLAALPNTTMGQGMRIEWGNSNGTPILIEGPSLTKGQALGYFQAHKDLLRLRNPVSELRFSEATFDRLGSRHEVFQQMHQGVPVWGGSIHAHFNRAGDLYSVNARYSPSAIMPTGIGYRISQVEALARATSDLARHSPLQNFSPEVQSLLEYTGPSIERNVWVHPSGKQAHWAWRVEIRPNFRDYWRYFIDSRTGAILEKYNNTHTAGPKTATATDLLGQSRTINTYEVGSSHYLIDGTRKNFNTRSALPNDPKGALWTLDAGNTDLTKVNQVASTTNTWTNATAVSAHYNMGRVYDYFLNTFGRAGIDGAGGTMISVVHVTEKGKKMDNAYWNGKAMAYGDGDRAFLPTPRALDIAAHEMTHGVLDATVNLEYKFQSGALNESLADIFGAMVDRDDWKVGEDAANPAVFTSGAMRDMENPHNGGTGPSHPGWQPKHMNEFLNLPLEDDNGGVHSNSGIPNHACFLIAKAIGREKTEKIYYRVLEAKYLNPGSQFIDMRLGAIRAATDLFGADSPEVAAVKDGFAGVGIGTAATPDKPTPRPPDNAPVAGNEFVAMVNATANDNSIYVANPVVKGDTDIVQLSETQVYTQTGNPMAITDDGSVLLFIDADNALRGIDELGEQVVSDASVWKSIAVSPDGSKVAATTLEPDAKIYVLDLNNPDNSKTISLYTPTTGMAVKANNVVFADALDFNSTGEYLLYDALNRVVQAEGDPIEYYDANLLDIKREIITPFLPARPDGISIGNPSFAQTSDLHIAFDLYDESAETWRVVTADLFTGSFQVLDSNGTSPGFPRYSTRDDKIVYERFTGTQTHLQQVPLTQDKYTPSGPVQPYIIEAQKPVWFAIGKRPAGIRLPGKTKPKHFSLRAGRTNGLQLDLPVSADVVVTAYDLAGHKRGELLRGWRDAGRHHFEWTSAPKPGLYVLRLEVQPNIGRKITQAYKLAWSRP
jgi:bacillolysin